MMRAVYKCRLCGKKFSYSQCDWKTATYLVGKLCVSDTVSYCGLNFSRHEMHLCRPETEKMVGLADFIGIEEEREAEIDVERQ